MAILDKLSKWIQFNKGGIQIYNIGYISEDKINDFFMDILAIIFILIAMYVAVKVGNHIIEKTVKKQGDMRISMDERKAKTLGAVLMSILRYTVYFFGVSAILSRIFGTISITFASIGGVAIGFGAQSLVKDIINGFFILFENHFAVGEYINIDNKSGIVESVELRVTKLRDFNGDLHIIPNGLITQVTNHSRGDMRVLVDVDVAYEENTENAIQVIQNTCDQFKEKNENMVEGPKVIGVTALRESGVTIRVVGKAKSMTQWECEHKLRKEIKDALSEAGVEIPYPKRKIVN